MAQTVEEALRQARSLVAFGWNAVAAVNGEWPLFDALDEVCGADGPRWECSEVLDSVAPNGSSLLFELEAKRTQADMLALLDMAIARAKRLTP